MSKLEGNCFQTSSSMMKSQVAEVTVVFDDYMIIALFHLPYRALEKSVSPTPLDQHQYL